MFPKELAGGFHGFQVVVGKFPTRLGHVPLGLVFDIEMKRSDFRTLMSVSTCEPGHVYECR